MCLNRFLVVLIVFLLSFPAGAQQPGKVARIGVLYPGSPAAAERWRVMLLQGLHDRVPLQRQHGVAEGGVAPCPHPQRRAFLASTHRFIGGFHRCNWLCRAYFGESGDWLAPAPDGAGEEFVGQQ